MKERIPTLKLDCEKILNAHKKTESEQNLKENEFKILDGEENSTFLNTELENVKSELEEALKEGFNRKIFNVNEKQDKLNENILIKMKTLDDIEIDLDKVEEKKEIKEPKTKKEESYFFKKFMYLFDKKDN